MGQKHYPKLFRDEAVLFYERGHTFAETKVKYGMAQSTFYEWKKQFDRAHPVPEASGTDLSVARKAQRHLEKLSLELEVLRQCPCGINASIDEKMAAIAALGNKYSMSSLPYVRKSIHTKRPVWLICSVVWERLSPDKKLS